MLILKAEYSPTRLVSSNENSIRWKSVGMEVPWSERTGETPMTYPSSVWDWITKPVDLPVLMGFLKPLMVTAWLAVESEPEFML